MRFPENENLDILITALVEYSNDTLIPILLKKEGVVTCVRSKNSQFNASAETSDCKKFTIIINDGILDTFMKVINNLGDETIGEDINEMSEVLLGDKNKSADIYRGIAYGATLFVILHEVAHIFRGHFDFIVEKELFNFTDHRFSFSELDMTEPRQEELFRENFLKLAELDADASSLNILLPLSLELYATVSDEFSQANPDRESQEAPGWRDAANKIMFYGASLALSLIDAKRGQNDYYPMPFTRIINILDVFRQDVYKTTGLLEYEPGNSGIQYLDINDKLIKNDEATAFMFLNAVDIMIECGKLEGTDLSLKFGETEEMMYKSLLGDFVKLSLNLSPEDLMTKEAMEYQKLRLLRPKFNSVFSPFIKKIFND